MPRDERTYIAVHDGMPDHPKVEALSDKAFRALIDLWCWSSRNLTDGNVPDGTWRKRVPTRARTELLNAGLVHPSDTGVSIHDYLEHQRSRETVETIKRARRDSAAMANHQRWHADKGIVKPECLICCPGGDPADSDPETITIPDTAALGSHIGSASTSAVAPRATPSPLRSASVGGSDVGSDLGSESDPSGSPESDTPSSLRSEGGSADRSTEPLPTRCPEHIGWTTPPPCGACRSARLSAEAEQKRRDYAANCAPTYAAPPCPDHPQHSSSKCPPCAAAAEAARQAARELPWRERMKVLAAVPDLDDQNPQDDLDSGYPADYSDDDADDAADDREQSAWEAHLADIAHSNAQEYLDDQAALSAVGAAS